MKKATQIFSAALAALVLCSCSASKKPDTNNKTSSAGSLPVLSIETVSKESNVLDFVNEPVAKHVSELIASWTPNYKMPPEPYYEDCLITLKDTDGNTVLDSSEAMVKVRGNWTTTYDKKPLRLKFTEKQSLLGLNDGAEQRNWLLLAEYKDGSMLRNRAALYASREIMKEDGLFAADSQLVSVEINGEYYGVYLLSDMQQVSSHRVKITEPETGYTGTDIGYFMEYDGYFYNEDELHGFPLDFADNAPLTPFDGEGGGGRTIDPLPKDEYDPKPYMGMTIKSTVNSAEQHDFIENYVNNVYKIMYEAAYNDKAYVFDSSFKSLSLASNITPQQAVENVVDVDSLADMYIISELTCDADIYWSSFYMDADFGAEGSKKLRFEAPWDFDSAMGNKNRCIDGTGFYAANIVPDVDGGPEENGAYYTINPWLAVIAGEDWYQDIVKEKWTKAYDSGVFERTCQLITDESGKYQGDFTKNYDKWNNIINNEIFAAELSAPAKECTNEAEAAAFLHDWLEKRVDFLNSQWHS